MDRERLAKQIDFILEVDKEKNIQRQTHLSNHGRRENDAEHAWHMALNAYLLKEYANEDIDIAKVMIMCLIHDVVEIDAGDTYAYDAEGLKTQKEREDKAKERIFGLLPEDQKEMMISLFDEFEAFDHAMDNFQPFLLNDSNDGGDWMEHGVSITQVLGRQTQSAKGSKELSDYVLEKLEEHVAKGHIKEDRKK